MPAISVEIKDFLGLFNQANSFAVPDAAMETASNVVFSKDGVISKRRGFYDYFNPSPDTINNVTLYQNTLMAIMSDKVRYLVDTGTAPNETGSATTLSGTTVAVTAPRVSRTLGANNNLYFTSDNGVLKLEAYNSDVRASGTPPALDLAARFISGTNGPLNTDGQTAWRVLFGRRDANDNLLLSVPSDVASLTNTGVVGQAYTVAVSTVTVTSTAHGLATGDWITVYDATMTAAVINGAFQITVTGANTFTYTTATGGANGNLSYVVNYYARLEWSIPSELNTSTDGYFFQVYRTSTSLDSTSLPDADWKLLDEQVISAGQITAGLVFFDDTIDSLLLDSAAELYTNPNSREGESQANARAPLCQDIALYQNHVVYANCTTRHLLNLAIIDSTAMASGDFIEVKVGATTRRYVARTGVANSTVTGTVTGSGTITITYTAHGLVNGDTVYVDNVVGGAFAAGTYTVAAAAANTFQITGSGTATSLDFQGDTNGTYPIFQLNISLTSASLRLRETASGIVKAINRDSGSLCYAEYTSGLTGVPGQFSISAKGFGDPIYVRSSSAGAGTAFSPVLPSSFASGTQVFSRNQSQPHVLFISKVGEPEAVPIVNFFEVGARNKAILRVFALRDSVIIIKEDGIFRLNGDSVSSFNITTLDNTVFVVDASSCALFNYEVHALSNQGAVRISDNAVAITSRRIEDLIKPIVGKPEIVTNAQAVGYESERFYILSTLEPTGTTNAVSYVYNAQNDTWATWDLTFKQGTLGPNDKLFLVTTGNKLLKERKTQTRIDFSGQNHAVTIVSVSSDMLSAVVTATTVTPEIGDVIVKSDVFSRVTSVSGVSPYTLTFSQETNLAAADSVILYEKFDSNIKMAPFHAGLVGREKQFAQMQIHTRDANLTELEISFTGAYYGGSEVVTWRSAAIGATDGGWGTQPWGFFPWGETDGISVSYGTTPAPIVRIYVPLFQQRNTFIQPILRHYQAGEAINMQALSWSVRSYNERVSR